MLIDLRTHIFSLISIFLALAVGIMIGSTMLPDGAIQGKQEELIVRLEEQIRQSRMDDRGAQALIDRFQDEIDLLRQQNLGLSKRLVTGRLMEKNILVIEVGSGELPDGFSEILGESGAHQAGRWVLQIPGDLPVGAAGQAAGSGVDENPLWWQEWTDAVLAQTGRREPLLPEEEIELEQAIRQGWLHRGGSAAAVPAWTAADEFVDAVIVAVHEPAEPFFPILHLLTQRLQKNQIPLVAVESSQTPGSAVPFWQSMQVSSIDAIDERVGQVSLVLLLDEGPPGTYGIKPSADGLLPGLVNVYQEEAKQ